MSQIPVVREYCQIVRTAFYRFKRDHGITASETLEFSAGFAAFFGILKRRVLLCYIHWKPSKCLQHSSISYHISLIWQVFLRGGDCWEGDLVSGGAKPAAAPLEHETVGSCYSLPISPLHPYAMNPTYHPQAFCTLSSSARIERPRWQPGRTQRSASTISRKKRGLNSLVTVKSDNHTENIW